MTNKNNKRFANRETTLKGETINLETMEKNTFEIVVPYVRSKDKAMDIASEKLELNDDTIINPKKFEIINETPKPIKYNDSKIYELSYMHYDNENDAKNTAEIDQTEFKAITWYEISCAVWAVDADNNYSTEFYADETPINMTKCDQRDFMRMSYEASSGLKVIGIHGCIKREKPIYCVIASDKLEKCIES